MRYHEIRPCPPLRPFVRCFWTLERDYRLAGDRQETVWPDGKLELIFHYGERYAVPAPGSPRPLPHGILIGPLTRHMPLRSAGQVRLFGARFFPWGLVPLLRRHVDDCADALVPAEQLLGRKGAELEERLASAHLLGAVAVLEAFLLERLSRLRLDPDPIPALARRILLSAGQIDLLSEAARSGLSLRQIERRFKQATGLSPKRMSVIARFDAARRFLLADPGADVTEVSYRFGYADYAHFSKDFRLFLGQTPHAFRRSVAGACALSRTPGDVVFLQEPPDPALLASPAHRVPQEVP